MTPLLFADFPWQIAAKPWSYPNSALLDYFSILPTLPRHYSTAPALSRAYCHLCSTSRSIFARLSSRHRLNYKKPSRAAARLIQVWVRILKRRWMEGKRGDETFSAILCWASSEKGFFWLDFFHYLETEEFEHAVQMGINSFLVTFVR